MYRTAHSIALGHQPEDYPERPVGTGRLRR
ncbi:hypothetical protein FB565_001659 [Actinoplanes lutulentus]|uniref:Uncharacterized protein n=1 Tax=Actinoplanes lutulentus TaxID=1287878 RepID=A0A327ZL20_9ACTN|nr:hypothetical protein [Actinoplanes lutulentus]RAK39867.1 hypothetical protein B0I29_104406 [Actinoplanes lutulentus]